MATDRRASHIHAVLPLSIVEVRLNKTMIKNKKEALMRRLTLKTTFMEGQRAIY